MSAVYDDIMSSLNELLDAAQGKETGIVVHPRTVKDVEVFSPQQIKQVRMDAKMTQKTFAACIGVSPKSVEAWEGGKSTPTPTAKKLLFLIQQEPSLVQMLQNA